MSVVALIHPTGLLGNELRETLSQRRELWQEMVLLTDSEDEAGTLTEVGGAAAMVARVEDGDLDRVDVAFFCADMARSRPLIERLAPAAAAIVLSPDATPEDGRPVVAGVNLDRVERGVTLLSPHPGAVLLAHLLHPLRDFRPRRATATLIQPISAHSREALDEVFEQTGAILRLDSKAPREIFSTQMAFNVIPSAAPFGHLGEHLRTVLGSELEVTVQMLRAGVFHSYGASLHVELGDDPGAETLGQALAEHPAIDMAVDPELLGMIDAAGRDEVLVGSVEPDPNRPGAYWIWAVMDNLTCGGAGNAVRIFEAIGGGLVH